MSSKKLTIVERAGSASQPSTPTRHQDSNALIHLHNTSNATCSSSGKRWVLKRNHTTLSLLREPVKGVASPSPLSPLRSAAEVTLEKHRSAFAASRGLPAPPSPVIWTVPPSAWTSPSSPKGSHPKPTKEAEFGHLRSTTQLASGRNDRPTATSCASGNLITEAPNSAKRQLETAIIHPATSMRLAAEAQLGQAQTKVQHTEKLFTELKSLMDAMNRTLAKEPEPGQPTSSSKSKQWRNSTSCPPPGPSPPLAESKAVAPPSPPEREKRQAAPRAALPNYAALTASCPQRRESLEDDYVQKSLQHIRLSKANSCMVRMGLQFEVIPRGGTAATTAVEPPQAAAATSLGAAALKTYLKERGWIPEDDVADSLSSDESDEVRLDSVAKHRLAQARKWQLRQQQSADLQGRIERRERRREVAQQQRREEPKRESLAMRQAMWVTIITLLARSFWEAPMKQRTVKLLTQFLIPLWRRYITLKKRRVGRMFLSAMARRRLPLPTEEQLRATGPLFKNWPSEHLQSFISKLYPVVFRYGEYVCHQGDSSHVLYILVGGAVEVVIRLPNSKTKKRGKKSGLTVATLTPIKYFGEYGVFADEPRAATLLCVSRVECWACSKEVFIFHLKRLPGPVIREINMSFEANLIKIYKVRPGYLATTPLFLNWDIAVLEELVSKLEPAVFYEDEVILRQGDPGVCMYLIARGQVECTHTQPGHPDVVCHLGTNAHLGVRACLFVEAQWYTIKSLTTVQAWCLKKSVLTGYMLQRPDEFIAAKQRLNQEFAKVILKPTVQELAGCSAFVNAGLPLAVAQALHGDHLRPRVVERTARLVSMGESLRELFFVSHGACTLDKQRLPKHSLLGLDLVQAGEKTWPHPVVALDRLEVWGLSVAALAQALEEALGKQPGKKAARALQQQVGAFLKATGGGGPDASRPAAERPR